MSSPRPLINNGLLIGTGAAAPPRAIAALTTGQIPVGVTGYPPTPASITTTVRAVPAVWVRVNNSVSQNIVDNTETAVTFDTEEFDTDGMYSLAAATRLTCVSAGVYAIGGQCQWSTAHLASHKFLGLRMNGSLALGRVYAPVPEGGNMYQSVTTVYALAVGNYVELTVFTTGDTIVEAWGKSFWAVRLGT